MAEQWYYARGQERVGPFTVDEIRAMVRNGQVTPETLVWSESLGEWQPVSQVPGLQAAPAAAGVIPPGHVEQRTNPMAITSLVMGILSWVLCCVPFVFGILAVIFGHVGLNQIKRDPHLYGGRGLAIAGLILGYVNIAFWVLYSTLAVLGSLPPEADFLERESDQSQVSSPEVSVPGPRSPATETSQEAEPKIHSQGDSVTVGYMQYTVTNSWWSNRLSDNEYLNEPPDAAYLFIQLRVRNIDNQARMVPPFALVDQYGAEYEASPHGWAVDGSIGVLDSLNPSVGKSGFIVFDVPSARNYRLKLSGGYWSTEDAYVALSPGRTR